MLGKRLLEVIRSAGYASVDGRQPASYTTNDELKSITDYLNKILTTKQGSVEIANDFGMPDYTTIVYESVDRAVEIISNELESVIEKYEPRLSDVVIKFRGKNDNELSLVFSIEALVKDHQSAQVYFQTVFSSDGAVSVKEA